MAAESRDDADPVGTGVRPEDAASVAAEIRRYQGEMSRGCTDTTPPPPADRPPEDRSDPVGYERVGLGPACESGFVEVSEDVAMSDAGRSRPVRSMPGEGKVLGYWLPGHGWVTIEQHDLPGYSDARWLAGAELARG